MGSEKKRVIKNQARFVKTIQISLLPSLSLALLEVTDFSEFYGVQCVQALYVPCSQHFIKDISSGTKHSVLAGGNLPDRKYFIT